MSVIYQKKKHYYDDSGVENFDHDEQQIEFGQMRIFRRQKKQKAMIVQAIQPSEYLKQLSEMFRQQAVLTRMVGDSFVNHSKQLMKLNELIFDECMKENIDIKDLKLNGWSAGF